MYLYNVFGNKKTRFLQLSIYVIKHIIVYVPIRWYTNV